MVTLTVWRFDTAAGADDSVAALEAATEDLPSLDDAAVVRWEVSKRRPHTSELTSPMARHTLGTGFWDLLFGLVFFVPLLGAALGAATGASAGPLADVGIDDHFVNQVRDQVHPGTSALFLLGSATTADAIHAVLAAGPRTGQIRTELTDAQLTAIREVFGP